jgi:hypothetical protein
MYLKGKISKILNGELDATASNEAGQLNEAIGGLTGFARTDDQTPGLHKNKDARRKRRERQGNQRLKDIKKAREKADKATAKGEPLPDPRLSMTGELRYTPKEAFLVHLAEYLNTGKSKHMMNALHLMEEYPALAKYVKESSQAALPQQAFSVYAVREHFSEEVGSPAYRSGENPHNWYLTVPCAKENCNHLDDHFIMEAKITPDKVLIYMPAFSKELEKLILSGKIQEPQNNVVRKSRSLNEIVLPQNIDSGLVIEIKRKGN